MILPAVVALYAKRIQGGFREFQGGRSAEYVRRVVTNHSLISLCSLSARIVAAIPHPLCHSAHPRCHSERSEESGNRDDSISALARSFDSAALRSE